MNERSAEETKVLQLKKRVSKFYSGGKEEDDCGENEHEFSVWEASYLDQLVKSNEWQRLVKYSTSKALPSPTATAIQSRWTIREK